MTTIKGLIFSKDGVIYEAYESDNERIGGYKLFTTHGESNPYRIFNMSEVTIKVLRKSL